jgi:hypothetical protein
MKGTYDILIFLGIMRYLRYGNGSANLLVIFRAACQALSIEVLLRGLRIPTRVF